MIVAAIIFFALAAVLGAIMLTYLLRGKHIPKGLALLHGPLAVIGLVLLICSAWAFEGAWWVVALFAAAATGGLLLLYKDITRKAPKWLGLAHGLLAVTGLLVLLFLVYHP